MGLTELLLGLLWFRSTLLCAGEKQQQQHLLLLQKHSTAGDLCFHGLFHPPGFTCLFEIIATTKDLASDIESCTHTIVSEKKNGRSHPVHPMGSVLHATSSFSLFKGQMTTWLR